MNTHATLDRPSAKHEGPMHIAQGFHEIFRVSSIDTTNFGWLSPIFEIDNPDIQTAWQGIIERAPSIKDIVSFAIYTLDGDRITPGQIYPGGRIVDDESARRLAANRVPIPVTYREGIRPIGYVACLNNSLSRFCEGDEVLAVDTGTFGIKTTPLEDIVDAYIQTARQPYKM